MTSLVVPTLDTLRQWLDDLGMSFFECDTCQALHLPHMQNFDGIFDAKVDLVDNVILFSAMAEVRPSVIVAAGRRSVRDQCQLTDGESFSGYAG